MGQDLAEMSAKQRAAMVRLLKAVRALDKAEAGRVSTWEETLAGLLRAPG